MTIGFISSPTEWKELFKISTAELFFSSTFQKRPSSNTYNVACNGTAYKSSFEPVKWQAFCSYFETFQLSKLNMVETSEYHNYCDGSFILSSVLLLFYLQSYYSTLRLAHLFATTIWFIVSERMHIVSQVKKEFSYIMEKKSVMRFGAEEEAQKH